VRPASGFIKKSTVRPQRPQTVKIGAKPSMATSESQNKIIITGDDVLIEYVHRLISALSLIPEDSLSADIKLAIDKFVLHYVWHSKDPANKSSIFTLKGRLQTRYEEMRQRRKRLVKSIYKREGKLNIFEESYKKMAQQKMKVLKNFNGNKLEEMLKTSTKNVAQEVVSILIKHSRYFSYGILPDLEKNYLKVSSIDRTKQETSKSSFLKTEKGDCGEEDEKEDEEVYTKHVLATSHQQNMNRFSSISEFNKKLLKNPPQMPPTVNYNNYINQGKYGYTSKNRAKNNPSSLGLTQNNSRMKLKAATKSENAHGARIKANIRGSRRNSFKVSESEYIKSSKPINKTSRPEILDQR